MKKYFIPMLILVISVFIVACGGSSTAGGGGGGGGGNTLSGKYVLNSVYVDFSSDGTYKRRQASGDIMAGKYRIDSTGDLIMSDPDLGSEVWKIKGNTVVTGRGSVYTKQ
jgi:hypothetical protein